MIWSWVLGASVFYMLDSMYSTMFNVLIKILESLLSSEPNLKSTIMVGLPFSSSSCISNNSYVTGNQEYALYVKSRHKFISLFREKIFIRVSLICKIKALVLEREWEFPIEYILFVKSRYMFF